MVLDRWSKFEPTWGQLWGNFELTWGQLWGNFEPTWCQLWGKCEPTWGQLWGNFESTWGQLWGNFEPTWDECIARAKICKASVSIVQTSWNFPTRKVDCAENCTNLMLWMIARHLKSASLKGAPWQLRFACEAKLCSQMCTVVSAWGRSSSYWLWKKLGQEFGLLQLW